MNTPIELALDLVGSFDSPLRPERFPAGPFRFRVEALLTAFPDARFDVDWQCADDERVVLRGTLRGTHLGPWRGVPATGRPVEVVAMYALAFRDGELVDFSSVADSLAIAEQIGAVAPFAPKPCQLFQEEQ